MLRIQLVGSMANGPTFAFNWNVICAQVKLTKQKQPGGGGMLVFGRVKVLPNFRPSQADMIAHGESHGYLSQYFYEHRFQQNLLGGDCFNCHGVPKACDSDRRFCSQLFKMRAIVEASKSAFREILAKIRFELGNKLLDHADSGPPSTFQQSCGVFSKQDTFDKSSFTAANMTFPATPPGFEASETLYKLTGCGMGSERAVFVWYAVYKCLTGCRCNIGNATNVVMMSEFRAVTDNTTQESQKLAAVTPIRVAYEQYFAERTQQQISLEAVCTLNSASGASTGEDQNQQASSFLKVYNKYLVEMKQGRGGPCTATLDCAHLQRNAAN